MLDASNYAIILTTTDNYENAQQIATKLLELSLAACIQIDEVESLYKWEGKIQKGSEYRLMIKTLKSYYCNIEDVIKKLNNYDNPQVIQIILDKGANDYLNWVLNVVS